MLIPRYFRSASFPLLCFLGLFHGAQAEDKILFIGNSFTFGLGGTQSVPTIFDALANAAGQEDPTVVMRAVSGKDFQYHHENSQTSITQKPWTHVVLQNYSTQPTHVGSVADHLNYGTLLYDAVMANNPGTQVYLYETWARAAVHGLISGTTTSTTFASTEEMINELRTNYGALASSLTASNSDKLPVLVSPAGDAWYNAGGNLDPGDPDFINLFTGDNYHGNDNGYYLSACVLYASIYKDSPVGLFTHPVVAALGLQVDSTDAAFLEQVAWQSVVETGLLDRSVRVDFGADATPTNLPDTHWNNLTSSQGTIGGTVLNDLDNTTGQSTGINLTVLSRFHDSNSSGTGSSNLYPATAAGDSLYGNTESFAGLSGVTPSIKLSGLDPETAYRFTFYASRTDSADNLQTRYHVTGDRASFVDLDCAGNIDAVIDSEAMYPDANGAITVNLTPGPANNSPFHFTQLGVLEVKTFGSPEITFDTQPASQTVEVNAAASFNIAVNSKRGYSVQWYQDDVAIPGATDVTYTIDSASAGQDGAGFTARVDNGVFEVASAAAILTLSADSVAPTPLGLTVFDPSTLILAFNEALASAGATDSANYRVANRGQLIGVTGVSLSPDGTTVTLSTASEIAGNVVVEPRDIIDLNGNPLPADSILTGTLPGGIDVYLDFGALSALGNPAKTWNELALNNTIRTAVGNGTGTPHVYSTDLLDASGKSTLIGLTMTDTMDSTNTNGTTSGPYPSGVTRDSFFGHTSAWSGFTDNGLGVFVFSNLNVGTVYDFTFYASRIGVTGNREARYSVAGATTSFADLDSVGNTSSTVAIAGISPDAAGEITLTISMGPNNNEGNGFFYINALVLHASEPAWVYSPVILGDRAVIDWTGAGVLQFSDDLTSPWTDLDPVSDAPYLDDISSATARFYRLKL